MKKKFINVTIFLTMLFYGCNKVEKDTPLQISSNCTEHEQDTTETDCMYHAKEGGYLFVHKKPSTYIVYDDENKTEIFKIEAEDKIYLYNDYIIYRENKKVGEWQALNLMNHDQYSFDFHIDELYETTDGCIASAVFYEDNKYKGKGYIELFSRRRKEKPSGKILKPLKFNKYTTN